MWGTDISRDQRGVSELTGTVLIVSFALTTSLLLFWTGWTVVGQLTAETTDSVTEDSMRNLDRAIADISGKSVNQSTTVEFPEDSGTDLSAAESNGEFTLSVTTNETFWNRTVAEARGLNRTGTNATVLGTIRHETTGGGVTAYQGGGLWYQADPDGETVVLSEPNVDVSDSGLDMGVVSLEEVDAVTEGSELTVRGSAESEKANKLRQFMALYWSDRYYPGVTAPVEVNLTIESQYAGGWATYAEERMAGNVTVIHPYSGDENKVRIVVGEIGDPPHDTLDPTFGDSDVLYAGSSDLAYMYHNDSVYGDFEGDPHDGPVAPELDNSVFSPPNDDYRLALYNESGRWIIYNNSKPTGDRWETAAGRSVEPTNTAALNTTAGPPGPSEAVNPGTNQFFIDPPAWVGESPTTPICVVTNDTSTPDITEYIDKNGEGCLETMVGVNGNLVSPIREEPAFNISVETTEGDLDETYLVDETVDNLTVNVTNEGETTGQAPVGAYIINETNWKNGDTSEAIFVNGTQASNLTLDPGESQQTEYTFDARHPLVDDNWTAFAATEGELDYVANTTTNNASFFEVASPDAQFDVVDIDAEPNPVDSGDTQTVNVTINESTEEISSPVTQYLRLDADGRLVNQTEVTYTSGENSSRFIEWEPRDSDGGTVNLTATTYDDNATTTATVNGPTVDESNFEVSITGTNSSIVESQNLTVDVTVTNTGNVTDTQEVVLTDFDNGPVGKTELTLSPSDTQNREVNWETVVGDAGNGTVRVVSDDTSDNEFVEIEEFESDTRDPADVMFAIDETGSMATYNHVDTLTVWDGSFVQSDISIGSTSSSYSGDFHHQVLRAQKSWSGDLLLKSFNQDDGFDQSGEVRLYSGEGDTLVESVSVTAGQTEVELSNVSFQNGKNYTIGHTSGVYRYPDERRPSGEYFDVVSSAPNSGDIGDDPYSRTYGFGEIIVDDGGGVGWDSYTVQEEQVVVFESDPCDDECQAGDYADSEWFIPGETITAADWDSSVYERISIKEVADGSWYCDNFGCYDPYGDRIKAARAALSGLNETTGDRAGALEFDTSTNTYQGISNDVDEVNNSLRISPGGGTDIAVGIEDAEEELLDNDIGNKKVLIVLTDGEDNVGGDPVNAAEDVSDDIPIYTVGFGGADIDTLKDISEGGSGEGEQYFADDTDELAGIFKDIVEDVTGSETPTFEVDSIDDTSEPVGPGETLQVNATISNTGSDGEQIVSLVDLDSGTYVDSERRSLTNGTSTSVTLEWDLTSVSPGDRDIAIRTVDDENSTTVTIDDPADGPELDITGVSTAPGSLTAGETLTVTADIENVGDDDATDSPVVLSVINENTGNTIASDVNRTDVLQGGTQSVEVEWNSSEVDVGDYDLEVETNADSATDNVTAQAPLTDMEVDIVNVDDPIQAGSELDVFVEVTNTGSETKEPSVVLEDDATGIIVDVDTDESLNDGQSETLRLTWDTRVGDGDENPVPVRVSIPNTAESDTTTAEIREANTALDGPSLDPSDNPIDIDISEIEIDT